MLNGKRLKAFPIRLRTKQVCLLLSFHFNITWDYIPSIIRQEREIKGIQIRKEVKLLFSNNVILWFRNINKVSMFAGHKVSTQKSNSTSNEKYESNIKKNISSTISLKKINMYQLNKRNIILGYVQVQNIDERNFKRSD